MKNSQANPYILNFTSNFDKDWQLYLLEGSGQISLDVPHFKINGATGNGWYINPNAVQNKDNYKLVIEYRPQRYFSWFLWISILSIATGVSIALILIRRKND